MPGVGFCLFLFVNARLACYILSMKNSEKKEIKENIKWFSKFSLLERLKISSVQARSIKILRGLKIEGIRKPA